MFAQTVIVPVILVIFVIGNIQYQAGDLMLIFSAVLTQFPSLCTEVTWVLELSRLFMLLLKGQMLYRVYDVLMATALHAA